MFDFKFDWDKKMETGIELIDLQHKELFKIAREIEQLIIVKCIGVPKQDMINVMVEIKNYVSYHFYQEEEIMKKYNYSDFGRHHMLHYNFKRKISKIDYNNLDSDPYNCLQNVKNLIQDWVFNHIIIEDHKMAKEIKAKMKNDKN